MTNNNVEKTYHGEDTGKVSFIFLVYGDLSVFKQLLFCLLTLHNCLKGDFSNINIVIYTDNIGWFSKYLKMFPILFEPLTKAQIEEYKGAYGHVHRVKTCVIKHCIEKYKTNVFFFDTDIVFNINPWPLIEKLKENVFIMNKDEYDLNRADELEGNIWILLRKVARTKEFTLRDMSFYIPFSTRMWNSGITALAYANKGVLDDILSITDQIYREEPIILAEQFATSYIFQNSGKLIDSENYVFHYWEGKDVFTYHIEKFFHDNEQHDVARLPDTAKHLFDQFHQLSPPAEKNKTLFERIFFRIKLTVKVAFKGVKQVSW